jgi:hypothetical protein
MVDEAVAERIFSVDGKPVACRFFHPEMDDGSYFCRYSIDWPSKTRSGRVGGVDSVQALLLAMQAAHVDLLMARKDHCETVMWLNETSS